MTTSPAKTGSPDALGSWLVALVEALVFDSLGAIGPGRAAGPWPLEHGRRRAYPALGPAVALAWLARVGQLDRAREMAVATLDWYRDIAPVSRLPRPVYRAASRFGRTTPTWTPGAAISAGAMLGWVIAGLEEDLTEARRREAIRLLTKCYDDTVRVTRLRHYINGNYQIPLCELAYFRWRFTGAAAATDTYEQCVEFLCEPVRTDPKWRGHGFRLDSPPTRADWHDAIGYFSETPRRAAITDGAFDGEYTQLQLDYVIRLWLLTGDARMLRYANALLNALLPLTDMETWRCDFRSGTRRQHIVPFWNAALATMVLHDPRPEFSDGQVRDQVTRAIDAEWRQRAVRGTIDDYCLRAYGLTMLNLLLVGSPALHSSLRC